jgi:hypothetical protein
MPRKRSCDWISFHSSTNRSTATAQMNFDMLAMWTMVSGP